jgi:hypothetical protein
MVVLSVELKGLIVGTKIKRKIWRMISMKERWLDEKVEEYDKMLKNFIMMTLYSDVDSGRDFLESGDYDSAYRLLGGVVKYLQIMRDREHKLSEDERR